MYFVIGKIHLLLKPQKKIKRLEKYGIAFYDSQSIFQENYKFQNITNSGRIQTLQ